MHFLLDAIAEIEGLLEVNRDFCKKQMAEKASPALPTNCAVVLAMRFRAGGMEKTSENCRKKRKKFREMLDNRDGKGYTFIRIKNSQ